MPTIAEYGVMVVAAATTLESQTVTEFPSAKVQDARVSVIERQVAKEITFAYKRLRDGVPWTDEERKIADNALWDAFEKWRQTQGGRNFTTKQQGGEGTEALSLVVTGGPVLKK